MSGSDSYYLGSIASILESERDRRFVERMMDGFQQRQEIDATVEALLNEISGLRTQIQTLRNQGQDLRNQVQELTQQRNVARTNVEILLKERREWEDYADGQDKLVSELRASLARAEQELAGRSKG